jgi:uncharacterized protein
VSGWYLDSSAAIKLLAREAESVALAAALDQSTAMRVSSVLLETELRRAARRSRRLDQSMVSALLETIALHELPPALFGAAGRLPGEHLRSLDALHLASAMQLDVEVLLTYDQRMASAAHDLGIAVLAPA